MTAEQAEWIRTHKPYAAVSQRPPGGYGYQKRGILHADGRFDPIVGKTRPTQITPGCFEVGVLTKTTDLERR
jgi:hypothetical protein